MAKRSKVAATAAMLTRKDLEQFTRRCGLSGIVLRERLSNFFKTIYLPISPVEHATYIRMNADAGGQLRWTSNRSSLRSDVRKLGG